MKFRKILMTSVLVASMSTGSVAFAASNATLPAHVSKVRVNKQEQIKSEILNSVAMILKLDQTTFIDRLKSGESISEIAKDSGIDKSYLIAKLISKEKAELDQEVFNGTLSLEREAVILYKVTSRLSTMMEQTTLLSQGPSSKLEHLSLLPNESGALGNN